MRRAVLMLVSGMMVIGLFGGTAIAEAPANSSFAGTWERTDKPVLDGAVARTWMWGPEAFTTGLNESYAESPGGQRTVQYFDKSRMEITDPSGDPNSIWFVTNGLLVVEMMTGQMQTGNNSFEARSPAQVNVAGDANDPNGPTYATFAGLRSASPLPSGQAITQRVSRGGSVTDDPSLASHNIQPSFVDDVTNHAIAVPFWDFMNSSGTVYENGSLVTAQLFENAFFATGRPVTESYWANVLVGGTPRDVLMQCFERRCLTYTPGNSEGFVVEAGNTGRHYHAWRYDGGGDPGLPPPGSREGLQCVELNYPCTLAETPPEVLQQIEAYGDSLISILDDGGSISDAEAWLLEQPDVVMTSPDDNALWYRLNGGPVVWLYDAPPPAPPEELADHRRSAPPHAFETRPHSVIGQDREPGADKRALILSPYKWFFDDTDEGSRLRDMLQEQGYQVDYRENPVNPHEESGQLQVWFDQFTNWNDYDVIHLSTHGSTDCDLSNGEFSCNSAIDTGIPTSAEDALDIDIIGATIGQVESEGDDDHSVISLTEDFFRSEYGDDPFATPLENALVFFSACESLDPFAELPSILAGDSSSFVGWDSSVWSGDASRDALAIYERALETGLPLNEVVSDLRPAGDSLGFGHREVPDAEDSADRTELDAIGASHIRLREVIDILDPLTGAPLEDNDVIPIFGEFGDGIEDGVPFRIAIDGIRIPEGVADEEAWLSDIVVHVEALGAAGPEMTFTLADDSSIGIGTEWEITGELFLGRDAEHREQITIRAWVELPGGPDCISRDEVSPRLDNPILEFHSIIETVGGGAVSLQSEVRAEFTLIYTSDFSSFEAGTTELEYVRYDIEVLAPGCTVSTTLNDGTLEFTKLEFPTTDGVVSSLVPDEVRLRPLTDISAVVTITCPQGQLTIPGLDIHWFAGWVVAHGGQGGSGGGVDEFDESEGVWVIENWQEVPPRKIYDQTIPLSGDVTLFEDTRLEITVPD